MPENAGRKFGKGELYQHNVLSLVKALLRLAKGDLTLDDSQLKAAVQVAWVAQNKLKVTGEYKEITKRGERVFEGTTKQDLWQLLEKTGTPLQLPQRQRDDSSTSTATRQADVVQNALYYLEDLGVLQDERPKNKRNTRYWIFTLTLKHEKASIEENLGVVKQKLGLEMLPPTDKSIDWQNICRTMLEKQKQLTTNRLMRADEMLFDIDRICVDLALVERKPPDKRSEDDNPARSQLYKPDYEETQKFEYKDFLTKVLKSEQSKKVAIIGEPGAGKTTLLQRIAFWILDNTDDLPIWIPLGNFPNPAPKFKDYLLNDWLEDAIPSVTPKIKAEFEELLTAGKVWLLLDGVDEMAAKSGSPLTVIANRIVGWCDRLRIVLTCRLNVWEANPYSLNGFQTYRTLEFSEEKVEEFIKACFQKSDAELGIQLQQALNQPGKERIKDLVRNPLRLTLLCSTWHLREGKLPDTKAELYQQYVEEVYRWKKDEFPTTPEERKQLNAKLKELALAAIDKEEYRFCLQHKFVEGILGDRDGSVFQLALNIGWLNRVGLDAKNPNPNQPVYAFFHPTFQEYFAALAIDDWDFFLPRAHDNHNPKPVSERYRIFEPQWQEPILVWLGRKDLGNQPNQLIKKLINFQDGCGRLDILEKIGKNFYSYQAYFLAGMGTSEIGECFKIENNIITQLIEWITGRIVNAQEKCVVSFLSPISDDAFKALLKSDLSVAIHTLERLVKKTESDYLSLWNFSTKNYSQCRQISVKYYLLTQLLGNIAKIKKKAIETIIDLIDSSKEELCLYQLIQALGLIDKTNTSASETLTSLIRHHSCKIRREAAFSLGKIDKANKEAVQTLVDLFENFENEEYISINFLRAIAEANNEYALNALIVLSLKYDDNPYLESSLEILYSEKYDFMARYFWKNMCKFTSFNPIIQIEFICFICEFLLHLLNRLNLWIIDKDNYDNYSRKNDLVNTKEYLFQEINRVEETLSKINSSVDSSEKFYLIDYLKDSVLKIGRLGQGNLKAIITLLKIIQDPTLGNSHFACRGLEDILEKEQMGLVVATLKVYVLPENYEKDIFYDCYKLIWHCAQNMSYPAFYQAWHQQEGVKTTTPDRQSLNQANLPQSLHSAIANDPQLSQFIHLICIDGSQFIEPNNPAAEIYDQMLDQNCPECDSVPETMPALKLYWNSLKRKSDKRPFLVLYASSTDATPDEGTTLPCPYSKAFLTDLSKSGREICVITEQRFEHIRLKLFAPSQTIEEVVEWIRAMVLEK